MFTIRRLFSLLTFASWLSYDEIRSAAVLELVDKHD